MMVLAGHTGCSSVLCHTGNSLYKCECTKLTCVIHVIKMHYEYLNICRSFRKSREHLFYTETNRHCQQYLDMPHHPSQNSVYRQVFNIHFLSPSYKISKKIPAFPPALHWLKEPLRQKSVPAPLNQLHMASCTASPFSHWCSLSVRWVQEHFPAVISDCLRWSAVWGRDL